MHSQALFLPEASDYIGSSPDESLSLCQPVTSSPFVLGLQDEARKHSLPINVGIHEPSDFNKKKIKNTLIWIDENGNIAHRYQKLHMFDMDVENGPSMKESDTVEPGNEILAPFDSPFGKIGSMICFDVIIARTQSLIYADFLNSYASPRLLSHSSVKKPTCLPTLPPSPPRLV